MSVLDTVSRLVPGLSQPTALIQSAWRRLQALPGGKRAFSRLVGKAAPYTGSIGAQVETARVGFAEVNLPDRRRVHNHLNSIHAAALANLAEMTGSLGMLFSLPERARFIPTSLAIDYLVKARGTITATCECPVPATNERADYEVPVTLTDPEGAVVARARLRVRVGPV